MSYIYMKSLENKAEKYDGGIQLLTLGKLSEIHEEIVEKYLNEGEFLLDLGMGTGSFAIACAKKGVKVVGVDKSEKMLTITKKKIEEQGLEDQIKIINSSIIELDTLFSEHSFDKVSAFLLFSELYEKEREFCIKQIHRILKPNGEFIFLDKVKPNLFWKKIVYNLIRIPLLMITFISTRLTTHPLKNIENLLINRGFSIEKTKYYLLDSLKFIRAKKLNNEIVR
ncbi:MAG: corrinoid protein-associated methyltransferase CpaM [Promethearchaeota archaeon]